MTTVGTIARACALIAITGVIGTVAGGNVHAQQDVIAQCAAEEDADLRIKCLEDALRASAPTDAVDTVAEEPVPVVPIAPAPQPTPPIVETPSAPEVANVAPVPAHSPAPSPTAPVATRLAPELGAEQVAARNATAQTERIEETERGVFAIALVEDIYPGKLRVTLQNGQVWQQIQGDSQRFDLDTDDVSGVEIWKSRLGGYKLRLTDQRRTLRVSRLR